MSLKAFENYHLSQGFITLNLQAHVLPPHPPKDISGFSQIKIIFKSAVAKTLWNHQFPCLKIRKMLSDNFRTHKILTLFLMLFLL